MLRKSILLVLPTALPFSLEKKNETAIFGAAEWSTCVLGLLKNSSHAPPPPLFFFLLKNLFKKSRFGAEIELAICFIKMMQSCELQLGSTKEGNMDKLPGW